MKRINVLIMIITASASIASAVTTAPKRRAQLVYVIIGFGPNAFSYSSVRPPVPFYDCLSHPAGRCEISTNIPLSILNSSFVNSFPSENDANPSSGNYVNYITSSTAIYKF